MPERKIGRVVSVDSFRVMIELDTEIKGSYKSGYDEVYEIAKINSYVIIPVADEKIVALVTRVKVNDETEIESFAGSISLPKSKRYLVATMTGTITGDKNYVQGVYNFPILDNPIWYVTKDDLIAIFDYKTNDEVINFEDDYFLSIGTSPTFNDFEVKINPDKFFGKHAAILGNTGSGKSCTVSTILQSILTSKFKILDSESKHVENANFIIFDTNGEYKKAFDFDNVELKKRVNAITINQEGLKVPYWFMNYDDFDYLFKPSANTQAPILKRAIELAKDIENIPNDLEVLPRIVINTLVTIKEYCLDPSKHDKLKELLCNEVDSLKTEYSLNDIFNFDISDYVNKKWYEPHEKYFYNDTRNKVIDNDFKSSLVNRITDKLDEVYKALEQTKIKQEYSIDTPIWFPFEELISTYIDNAIDENEQNNNRLNEFLSTLRLRLRTFFSDERFSEPFMLKDKEKQNLLSEFIQFIMGVMENSDNIFSKYQFSNCYEESNSQITIIDMSLLPHEVLENVTGLIGRLVLEFLSRLDKVGVKRGSIPTVIVLEEAQHYIPEKDRDPERTSISKRVFERIAREGRKFGLSLLVSSQRPSELSKTVLSQCNTFIVHRLQNPEDQRYIKQVVSSVNEDILNQLPVLPQQHAIIMGDAVRSPVQVRLRDVNPAPDSRNPEFFKIWTGENTLTKEVVDKVTNNWIGDNVVEVDKKAKVTTIEHDEISDEELDKLLSNTENNQGIN